MPLPDLGRSTVAVRPLPRSTARPGSVCRCPNVSPDSVVDRRTPMLCCVPAIRSATDRSAILGDRDGERQINLIAAHGSACIRVGCGHVKRTCLGRPSISYERVGVARRWHAAQVLQLWSCNQSVPVVLPSQHGQVTMRDGRHGGASLSLIGLQA